MSARKETRVALALEAIHAGAVSLSESKVAARMGNGDARLKALHSAMLMRDIAKAYLAEKGGAKMNAGSRIRNSTAVATQLLASYRKANNAGCSVSAALEWHFCPDLPDDEVRVLFAAGEEVEVGHHEGDHWETAEGGYYGDHDVYAWAHLPAAPDVPAKGGAK